MFVGRSSGRTELHRPDVLRWRSQVYQCADFTLFEPKLISRLVYGRGRRLPAPTASPCGPAALKKRVSHAHCKVRFACVYELVSPARIRAGTLVPLVELTMSASPFAPTTTMLVRPKFMTNRVPSSPKRVTDVVPPRVAAVAPERAKILQWARLAKLSPLTKAATL